MNISIAIDGPGGAGKSTVAREVASRLGILHLDTGAMYRAFAWEALRQGVDVRDENALAGLAERTRIEVDFQDGKQRTFIGGEEVSGHIRTPEIGMAASDVSAFEPVRRFMVRMQQELAKTRSMVLDGRDIGLTVLPDATLKVFLTASPEARARRRFDEMTARGEDCSYEAVFAELQKRDLQDTTREVEPLRPAPDAVVLDTSDMTREDAVSAVLKLLEERKGAAVVVKERFTWTYRLTSWLCFLVFHTLFPVRYHHVEKAQLDAPFILICNHYSMLDPLIAGWRCTRYQIRFFGKKELVKNPILRAFFRSMRMIPVDRHNMDMAAVRACLKALREGHPLCIFPEGTRHKKGIMENLESGVAVIALRAKAPLVPAYITAKPRLFRGIDCYFGDPIAVEALATEGSGRENGEALLDVIRATYRALVAEHLKASGKG